MVAVEYFLSPLYVDVLWRVFSPRQVNECLKIGEMHVIVRALRAYLVKFVKFIIEEFLYFLRPFLVLRLHQEFLLFGR